VRDDESKPTVEQPAISPSPLASFRLTVEAGPDKGKTLDLDGSEQGALLVGKSPACALVLSDPLVSRRHVSVEIAKSSLRMVDVGSTNGTFLGKMRLGDVSLDGDDRVRIGDTTILVTRTNKPSNQSLTPQLELGRIIGISREMRRLYPLIEKLADTDVPILIEGETGTGKEVLAETIHRLGPRASKPFIVFDCTTVSPSLVESELFGHERGAFTGATATRKGVFEQADGGTLLIDEIGDLDHPLQPKLLRAIERGEVRRVGGSEVIAVNVRVLSATRRDLDREVQAGRFRDDLYHRLVVARIELPPLRRRRGDISLLARHFARELGGAGVSIPPEVLARWEEARWPGNVRELRNAVAKQLALGDMEFDETRDDDVPAIEGEDAAPAVQPEGATSAIVERVLAEKKPLVEARQRLIEEFDRAYLARVLAEHNGNVTRAAAAAGLARRNFQILRHRRGV
jgi:transcriptional regulator with GAF, ATPase, and Fis domain